MQVTKFRKKPVVIEAVKFETNNDDGTNIVEITNWINQGREVATHDNTWITIHTLEGLMRATPGDYVIKGVKGEFYPCKPDIFISNLRSGRSVNVFSFDAETDGLYGPVWAIGAVVFASTTQS